MRKEESEIVSRARSGDRDALAQLYLKNKDKIYGAALRLLNNVVDAEDAVSETFVIAFKNIDSFRGESDFSTWLYRICFNVVYHHKRKEKLIFPETDKDDDAAPYQWVDKNQATVEDLAESAERERILKKCIALLGSKHREIILLREISGLDYKEIAAQLGCSTGTVMSRLHRARQELRKLLEKEGL